MNSLYNFPCILPSIEWLTEEQDLWQNKYISWTFFLEQTTFPTKCLNFDLYHLLNADAPYIPPIVTTTDINVLFTKTILYVLEKLLNNIIL